MAIEFHCPQCGKAMQLGDQFAGAVTDCPRCGRRMSVPAPIREESEQPRLIRPATSSDVPLITPSKRIDFEDLIDMTAMVDIVFFLLIFFLVTSMHALDSSIPLPAPNSQSGAKAGTSLAGTEADDASVTVQIARDDTIRVDDVAVRTPQELLFKLNDLRRGPSQPDKVLVIGHADASHGTAVLVLDAARDAGFDRIGLSVRDETE